MPDRCPAVRTSGESVTDDGSPYGLEWGSTNDHAEDDEGNPVYDWTVMDRIFDTWIERGMKPLVEIGLMPRALSTNPDPYNHKWQPADPYGDISTGWLSPPNDHEKWVPGG